MIDRVMTSRRKLLRPLSLRALWRVSGVKHPRRLLNHELLEAAARNWDEEAVRLEIEAIFLDARGEKP